MSLHFQKYFLKMNPSGNPYLWSMARGQVDRNSTHFISSKRCIVLQAIAGAILMNGQVADKLVGVWTAKGCCQLEGQRMI